MNTFRAALAVAILGCTAAAGAQTPATTAAVEMPVVVASGEAVVKKAPDRAFVSIATESRAKTSREAQRMNADVMTATLAKLKSSGIGGDAIQTTGYDLQPEFDYANGRQTLKGYVARNAVDVRVDDLPKLGEVLDVAISAGANSVSGVRFDLRDRSGAEREALQKAVEDARARATAAATGAGMRVDKIVRIEESRAIISPPRPMMMAMRAEAKDVSTPIVAGELEIRASVTLTASIR